MTLLLVLELLAAGQLLHQLDCLYGKQAWSWHDWTHKLHPFHLVVPTVTSWHITNYHGNITYWEKTSIVRFTRMCYIATDWKSCGTKWLRAIGNSVAPCHRHVINHPVEVTRMCESQLTALYKHTQTIMHGWTNTQHIDINCILLKSDYHSPLIHVSFMDTIS